MVVPVIKIFSLAVKQITKPVAKHVIELTKDHPKFRRICVRTGQLHHRVTQFMQGRRKVTKLGEDAAVAVGSEALVELSVFFVGALILAYEVRLSMEKEKRKEAALQARFVALEANVEFLRGQNSGLEGQLSMLRLLHHSRPNKSPSLEYLVDKLYTTTDKKDS
eukprot:TRINITY_DN6456_c0_g1_i1.p1 TRINITY_DN6456_c0_g1~~TRINITY_DN6456_c0_g1_i1.p1  ORF type:complete len:164 (-),score=26.36 TRINITY_DN6456_c0_g1_i1:31-522(-)